MRELSVYTNPVWCSIGEMLHIKRKWKDYTPCSFNKIGVTMTPGWRVDTWIPNLRTSCEREVENASSAAFEAQYDAWLAVQYCAAIEVTLIMEPGTKKKQNQKQKKRGGSKRDESTLWTWTRRKKKKMEVFFFLEDCACTSTIFTKWRKQHFNETDRWQVVCCCCR